MDFDFGYSVGLPFAKSPFARLIPTFAGSQYGTIDTLITFTDDFEIPIKFASTDTSGTARGLFGDSTGGVTNYFQPNDGSGKCNFKTDDGIVSWTHLNEHLDGKIYTLTAYRSGLTIGIKLNGVVKSSLLLGAASIVDIDLIGALGINSVVSQPFNGQLLSAKFIDAGTVVANYVFDSGSTTEQFARGSSTLKVTLTNFATTDWNRYTQQRNITYDAGVIGEAWVGDNIVVNGQFNTDADWVKQSNWTISGGKANSNGVVASQYIRQENIIAANDILLLKYNISGYSAGNMVPAIGGTNGTNRSVDGDFSELITPIASTHVQMQGINNFVGNIDNVFVNHILEVA